MKNLEKQTNQEELTWAISQSNVSKNTLLLIAEVIESFPEDIQDFVVNNLFFIEPNWRQKYNENISIAGYCLDNKAIEADYIIYFDSIFAYIDRREQLSTIAHEIGHAYLKHSKQDKTRKQEEKEADEFAAKYGYAKREKYYKLKSAYRYFIERAGFWDWVKASFFILLIILIVFFSDRFLFLFNWAIID